MSKRRIVLNFCFIVIGLIFVGISFWKQSLSYYRIILMLIGLLFIVIGFFLFNRRIKMIPFNILFFLVLFVFIDSFISITFCHIPIFAYNVTNINNSRVYDAIGYRIWDCEGKKIKVDTLYKLGYYCDVSDIEEINSNAFLGEIVDKFVDYKNKYIKINGKISRKEGNNFIEMQAYQTNEITLNGYVTFSDKVTLRVVFKNGSKELEKYDVYDNITVVGKLWYMKEDNEKYIIYMDDSSVVSDKNYDDYEILITENKNCNNEKKLLYKGADYKLYSACLSNIIVKFENNGVYEISSVLSSGKLEIDTILSNFDKEVIDENLNLTIYEFEKYKIVKCNEPKGEIIIFNNNKLINNLCKK